MCGPRYVVTKGKTPVLAADEARALLDSIPTDSLIGLRDRALIGVMVYTFARVNAVIGMKVKDYFTQGRRGWVRLHEKGGKEHEVPCHHMLEKLLDEYLAAAGIGGDATPVGKIVHIILDNYGSHKHPKVRAWLDRHPRFVFHYTPKSASWLNAVEGFFAKLTRRRLKRGVFHSLVDLQAAIKRFLTETNDSPKPFVWTADPNQIIAAVKRGYQVLDSIHSG